MITLRCAICVSLPTVHAEPRGWREWNLPTLVLFIPLFLQEEAHVYFLGGWRGVVSGVFSLSRDNASH